MRYSYLVLSLLLGGCVSLSPEYVRPSAPIATTFQEGNTTTQGSVLTLSWKAFIRDERLTKVIEKALEQSRDLRKAVANIEAARANYRIQRSGEFPSIEASATGSKARSVGSNGTTSITQSSSATVGLSSYELDFFGKNSQLSAKEWETFQGVAEAERLVRITLIADTATAWFTLASDLSLLTLSKQTLESANQSLAIVQKRVDLGVDSDVSLFDVRTTVQQARANVANYTTLVAQDKAALELLVGASLDASLLPSGLDEQSSHWLMDVPVGLSSDILLQRPDVLEAEHNLKAANANIGVARAAYFPSMTLTTKGGLGSNALSGLFTGGTSTIWSFVPTISLPIFDAGERDATLAYAKANRDALLATYELSIQTAFKEVSSALARRATIVEQLDAQKALVEADAKSYALYDARYQKGIDSYINVLTSQRALYSAEQSRIAVSLEALNNRVTLYRVLGGGLAQN